MPSQNSNQKDANAISGFFEPEGPIHEHDTNFRPPVTENFLEENFSNPKPEKFLHRERGVAAYLKLESPSDHFEAPNEKSSSGLQFGEFFQLMVCKYLLQDNQKMRARLNIQTDSIKEKFEKRLLCRLNQTLSFKFDF